MKNKYYVPSQNLEEKKKLFERGAQTCSKCRVLKPLSEFTKDLSNWTGRSYWCKSCKNASIKEHRKKNPELFAESMRFSQAKIRYGIDKSEYLALLIAQDNKCGICRGDLNLDKHTCIDHDHSTGEIRGVLCSSCNKGLGFFKDSIDLLEASISYLENNFK